MSRNFVKLILLISIFLIAYFIPIGDHPGSNRIINGLYESLAMLQEYARAHMLLCLLPAFFIAGGISIFIRKESVVRYFGAKAKKWISYSVASISGSILAVCSCTVLPLFAGLYSRGAGIGPSTTFLYSGPAINVMAIILTAQILGVKLGIARAVGAVLFGIIIGLLMSVIFKNDKTDENSEIIEAQSEKSTRPLWQEIVYFGSMMTFLIFANWAKPSADAGVWSIIYDIKWYLAGGALVLLAFSLILWYKKTEVNDWMKSTWEYVWLITPLLFIGVLVAGFLLGRPGYQAMIPDSWVAGLVGGNSFTSNLFASIVGAFMYFATLTEVPILQGLLGAGMGEGPALALLLSGPALSLPNMLVIRQVLGTSRTIVFVVLVILISTIAGMIYGYLC